MNSFLTRGTEGKWVRWEDEWGNEPQILKGKRWEESKRAKRKKKKFRVFGIIRLHPCLYVCMRLQNSHSLVLRFRHPSHPFFSHRRLFRAESGFKIQVQLCNLVPWALEPSPQSHKVSRVDLNCWELDSWNLQAIWSKYCCDPSTPFESSWRN